jgi:hypothetical protein
LLPCAAPQCRGGSPTAVVSSGTHQRLIPPMTSSPRSALGPLGGHSVPGLVVMGGSRRAPPWCLRCGDRSPGAFWRPAPLESVDRWPLAIPETQIPGGSHPVGSAVRRRCPRGLDPSSEGHMPQPASAFTGAWSDPCVRTGAEEFSGGNWMVSASPRYAGGAAATGRLVRPFHLTTFYPLGGRAPGLKPRVALP